MRATPGGGDEAERVEDELYGAAQKPRRGRVSSALACCCRRRSLQLQERLGAGARDARTVSLLRRRRRREGRAAQGPPRSLRDYKDFTRFS